MTKSWCARAALVLLTALMATAVACSGKDPNACKVTCSADSDCPMGQTCGDVGRCTSGDKCTCTPGEFHDCLGSAARVCNAAGDGFDAQDCGASGCNAGSGRCNACVAGTIACSADSSTVDQCGSDGLVSQSDACAAGCTAGASPGDPARCKHIDPFWLTGACDALATAPTASLGSATLDTTQDASCTGGIVSSGSTEICVVRATRIDIGDLKVTGTRAIAFVADEQLTVSGMFDVSADGTTSGPGFGTLGLGGTSSASYKGAGGAGFAQQGGAGGGDESGTQAGLPGGSVTDRPTTMPFVGGAPGGASVCGATTSCLLNGGRDFGGGGGGGGALLVSCYGTVSITGVVDAGGGGGAGGGDHFAGSGNVQGGGAGGGAGGFVVFQGVNVSVTGKLYANGGGGGAGCASDDCRGLPGADGQQSTAGAPGGDPPGNTDGGGIGGSILQPPGTGEKTFSSATAGSGGGGGSVGRFAIYTPAGIAPTVTPAEASPAPDPGATVSTE